MLWIILVLVILGLLLGYLIIRHLIIDEEFDKIPGPEGKFLFGNALDFLMDSVKTFQYFVELRNKYVDGYKLKLGGKKIIILYNPEDVETLISGTKCNNKGFIYRFLTPWLNDGLLLSDGAKWHQRRKVLTPAFHFNILRHFNSILVEQTLTLAEKLKSEVNNPKTNLFPYITDLSLHSICETAMGTALDEEAAEIGKKYKNAINTLGTYLYYRAQRVWMYTDIIFNYTQVGRHQRKLLDLMASFRKKVIEKRKQNSDYKNLLRLETILNDDEDDVFITKKKRLAMLDLLFEAEKEGSIDSEGIDEEVDTFMFEGYDTTATALQFMFMLLANHEEIQDKIVQEYKQIFGSSDRKPSMNDLAQLKYLEACIKESLRLYPPVHFITRECDQPLQLKNFRCPAGTDYTITIFNLHRRSDQFEEPEEYRPERFLKEPTWHPFCYLPFSAGPRNCIGQKFAMLEMKLAVSAVLCRYRLLPITTPKDIVFYIDMILRTKDPIYVKIEDRT